MRLLIAILLTLFVTACAGEEDPGLMPDTDDDAEFATELMHRDASLLNLLDVSLGRDLDPRLAATGEQQRVEANERMTTAAELLEGWGEEVPTTSRAHDAEHSSDNGVPEIDGMPTGDDIRQLGKLDGKEFAEQYVALLTAALESTKEFAEDQGLSSSEADQLAKAAVASTSATLDAL